MDVKAFLKDFFNIAASPNGIEQIRILVMGLALSGDLQADNEKLPDDFKFNIQAARQQYFDNLGRKNKPFLFGEPLLQEFRIPDGWQWVRVGELCDLQTGSTPSTQRPEYFGGDIRWLVSGDINKGEIYDCNGRITEEGRINSNCKILPPNCVLIALNGQGKTRASVAILRVPATCNQSLVAIIPISQDILLPEFLHLSLKYRYHEIRNITGQNQRRGLNMSLVSELSIPLPPIQEQRYIVNKVNELLVLCDKLEKQTEQGEELCESVRTASLNSLNKAKNSNEFKLAWIRIEQNISTLFNSPKDLLRKVAT